MARRAVEQELTRERILEVARHLFVTKGYRAISMRSIGQQLGYSHGSLYYHFKEKAELFYALVVEDFNALIRVMERVYTHAPGEGIAKLEHVMLELIRFGLEKPHHYEIMFLMREEEMLAYCRTEQARSLELFSVIVRQSMGPKHPESLKLTLPLTLFLSVHGFISYYIQDRVSFDEVKPAALSHIQSLLKIIETPVIQQ